VVFNGIWIDESLVKASFFPDHFSFILKSGLNIPQLAATDFKLQKCRKHFW